MGTLSDGGGSVRYDDDANGIQQNASLVLSSQTADIMQQQLGLLPDGLETVLAPLPDGCVTKSIKRPPAYGIFATGRVVGHVSLHAAQRGDPWPPTCDWIRARP